MSPDNPFDDVQLKSLELHLGNAVGSLKSASELCGRATRNPDFAFNLLGSHLQKILSLVLEQKYPEALARCIRVTDALHGQVIPRRPKLRSGLEKAAQEKGRLGGKIKSESKAAAARRNGRLGGRPRKRRTRLLGIKVSGRVEGPVKAGSVVISEV